MFSFHSTAAVEQAFYTIIRETLESVSIVCALDFQVFRRYLSSFLIVQAENW